MKGDIMDNVWFCSDGIKKRTIMEKNILLAIKSDNLLMLNEQAMVIWEQIVYSKTHKEKDIIAEVQSQYPDTSVEKLKTDVYNCLIDFQKKGFAYCENNNLVSRSESSDSKKLDISGHFSFSEEFHQLAAQHNAPISAGFEITQRCNLRCIHCYIDNQPIDYSKELSTKEVYDLLDQIVEKGCLWLLVTGGEPLLRKDFCEIYRYAKELGMIVTVFTSATNITKQVIDSFIEYPPFLVEATLHSANEEVFDSISAVSGSFRQFKHGIGLLQESKIPFHLKMIVMRQNVREIEQARQFALKIGANDFRFDTVVNIDFRHSDKALDLRIPIKEAIKLDCLEPYKSRWQKVYQAALIKKRTATSSDELLFPCRAGKCSFTISADGQLLPCILIRTPAYNLRELSFSEAWEKMNYYTTTTYMKSDNPCFGCSVQTCSKCPAWGYLEHGDANKKSQFICDLERERENIFLHNCQNRKEGAITVN